MNNLVIERRMKLKPSLVYLASLHQTLKTYYSQFLMNNTLKDSKVLIEQLLSVDFSIARNIYEGDYHRASSFLPDYQRLVEELRRRLEGTERKRFVTFNTTRYNRYVTELNRKGEFFLKKRNWTDQEALQ